MDLQIFAILRLLFLISIGSAQDVSDHDGLTTSKILTSQAINTSDVLVNEFSDTYNNLSNTDNSTSNPNNGLTTVSLTSRQNISTSVTKLPNITKTNSIMENATDELSVPVTVNASSTETFGMRKVDIGMNKSIPSIEQLNINIMRTNATKFNQSTATEDPGNISTIKAFKNQSSNGNISNDLISSMADGTGNGVTKLIITDEKDFVNSSFKVNKVTNTEQARPAGSSIPNEVSVSGPGSTEPDQSIQNTSDAANVSENGDTRIEANMIATNTSADGASTLPKIIWEPGMKQPQTISDLIRMTGADIKFIASQFESNINEIGNTVNTSDVDRNKTVLNVSDNTGIRKNNINRKGKDSLLKRGDKLTNTTVTEKFEITGSKVETISTDIKEITPSTTADIVQDGGETHQLASINDVKAKSVSAPTIIHGIDISAKSNDGKVINISPSVAKTADGSVPKGKFNTRQSIQTIVVVKRPGNVSPQRLDIVSHLESRDETSRDDSDLSYDEFRRDGELRTPSTRQGSIPITSVSQVDTASGHIVSFGNNPQYTIGSASGNSVQIPRFISGNRFPVMEPAERMNQRLFHGRPSRPSISGISSGMDRTVSGGRFTTGTITSPFLRDASRFETRGMSSSLPTESSSEFIRSDIVRTSMPIQSDFGSGSARNSITGGQVFDGRMAMGDSSSGTLPVHNGFRSASSVTSFDVTPFVRGIDNRARISGSVRGTSAMPSGLGGMIPREIRQRADTVTRNDISGEFSRQQSFGEGISNIGFGSSVIRPRQIERSIGFRREFPQPRDSNDRLFPRAVSFGRSISRDGPGFRVPIRGSTFTAGAFGRSRLSTDITGIRTPMFPVSGVIDRRIRPTGIFTYRPSDMFAPSPYIRPF
ncbi:uncharacterized protein LOC128555672 [Mercenaria mercenaria]|uniref:uncharacterized protein LOC128555672 n=1 Tax=Mercenaria mercenaria TaxID=6596 RepID=UPI00234E6761|nr:uncharacterized protein LOC128555672 [Mercenaria mercenaria]XP_053394724.1 uncharacterized protein LOC128555672 [Mercenaria mercenaria]